MKIIEVKDPNTGRIIEIKLPEGMTPQEAIKKVVKSKPAMWESVLGGAGKTLFSLMDLIPGVNIMDDETTGRYEQLKEANPISTMAGEALPYMAASPATMGGVSALGTKFLPPALAKYFGPTGLGTFVGEGAAIGAIDPSMSATEGALSGVAGKVLSKITAGRHTQPGMDTGSVDVRDFRDAGYKLSPGEMSGRQSLQTAESFLRRSGYGARAGRFNQALTNQKITEAIGQPQFKAPTIEALSAAQKELNSLVNTATDGQLFFDNRIYKLLPAKYNKELEAVVKGNRISGKDYHKLVMKIKKSSIGNKKAVLDMLHKSRETQLKMSAPEKLDALIGAEILEQNLDILKRPGVLNPETGEVDAKKLWDALSKVSPETMYYTRAKGPMEIAARTAKAFPEMYESKHLSPLVDLGTMGAITGGAAAMGAVMPDMNPWVTAAIVGGFPLVRRLPTAMYNMGIGMPGERLMTPRVGQYAQQVIGQLPLGFAGQ